MGELAKKSGVIIKVGDYQVSWYTYIGKIVAYVKISKIDAPEGEEYNYDILKKRQVIRNKCYLQIPEDIVNTIKMMLGFSYHSTENNSDQTLWQSALYSIMNENERVASLIDLDQPIPDFKFRKKPGRKAKVEE